MLAAVVLASRGVLAWSAGEATAPAAAALVPGVTPDDAFAAAVGVPALAPAAAPSDLFARAEALAREAEEKSKALAEAEAAEEEMAKRASTARTQETEARLLATQKKDEAKDDLNVAQQAERQAVTAVQKQSNCCGLLRRERPLPAWRIRMRGGHLLPAGRHSHRARPRVRASVRCQLLLVTPRTFMT